MSNPGMVKKEFATKQTHSICMFAKHEDVNTWQFHYTDEFMNL
jgi:hypothetical protein